MKNYHLGRPYSDYEYDVLMLKMSGSVVGELNHSRKFPAVFRSSVCKVVNKRSKNFIQTPLIQTGHLPCVGVSADKGTYKHRSRQFVSIVVKACKPPLLQVTTLMNKVKKVLGITRVKRLGKKVAVIH